MVQQNYLFLDVEVYFMDILAQLRRLQDTKYYSDISSQTVSSLLDEFTDSKDIWIDIG